MLQFLVLLISIAAIYSQDIDVEIDYNPCTFKVCSNGEVCRAVVQRKLLEMPIAICVASEKELSDMMTADCTSFSDGENILNCKTEEEWVDKGRGHCTSEGLTLRSTEVKHICHDTYIKRYLQAKFTCCPKEHSLTHSQQHKEQVTPTVMTSTPPVLTTDQPAQQENDDTSSMIGLLSTEESKKSLLKERDWKTSYIPFIVGGVAFFIIFGLVITCFLYRRQKKLTDKKASSKSRSTVVINPHCDDYQYVFNEITYHDLSIYSQAPEKF